MPEKFSGLVSDLMMQTLVSRSILTLGLAVLLLSPMLVLEASAPTRPTGLGTPDFTVTANPTSITLPAGSTASSTISLTSLNGFTGTINLSTSAPPLCPSCPGWGVSPSSLNLGPGSTGTATLTFYTTLGSPLNKWIVTVTATSGSLSHSTDVSFTVVPPGPPDFSMSANPSSLTIPAGTQAMSTITLTSLNGFSGTVTVSSPSPLCPSPLCTVWSVYPGSVNLVPGGTAQTILTVDAGTQGGPGGITVYGTSGSLSHSVTVSITILFPASPDFSIAAYPNSLTIDQGYSASYTLFLTSLHGFQGNVNLTASLTCTGSSCPTVTLSPTIVHLAVNATATSILTVYTQNTTPPVAYTITVVGSSGSLSHSATVTLTVDDPPAGGGGGGAAVATSPCKKLLSPNG